MVKVLVYSTVTCVKPPLSNRPKIGSQYQLLLNSDQKYCRMLQMEHYSHQKVLDIWGAKSFTF